MTARRRGRVLVAGSANLDFVVRAPRVPAPGETILGYQCTTFPGGKGANQAVACARAGHVETRMLVALGDDPQAEPIEASLRSAGVQLDIVRTPQVATGAAFVCVGDDGENAITVVSGANAQLREEDLPELHGVDCLLLQLETPLASVEAWARKGHVAGVTVVLNAAPAQQLPESLLAVVDLLVVNEGELATVVSAHGDIAARIGDPHLPSVVVTLGARGCCANVDGRVLLQPGFRVEAVDTTGAGDTFCGTLAACLAAGESMDNALRRASAASALACTRFGAQTSVPSRSEVDAMLASGEDNGVHARDALAAYCGLSLH
ncbi:ribokinase [Lysobacter sp. CFH 32150]|uniref:ribokinase n=1 Tax=Lysobacter sp. CFH 32150 TaxID=2927128 RepID=UPI001FA7C5B7|nr:ribokinase [Lysobacter sp. CFH 32150]MCI4567788.1 ribokinase [Lysobacter sp. CFH 32150]